MKILSLKKVVSLMSLILVMAVAFTGCGAPSPDESGETNPEEVMVWKLAHSGRNDDMLDTYAKKFKEYAEQEFEGKVEIELYPAEQLGDDTT
ncbi:MAG: hypothetical protein MJA31_20015, partial [Clostridia bacterium]|nr:hypothetical protein [Clostridia bacterium]